MRIFECHWMIWTVWINKRWILFDFKDHNYHGINEDNYWIYSYAKIRVLFIVGIFERQRQDKSCKTMWDKWFWKSPLWNWVEGWERNRVRYAYSFNELKTKLKRVVTIVECGKYNRFCYCFYARWLQYGRFKWSTKFE